MVKRGSQPSGSSGQLWLQTLGITSMRQWDVLVFLHRHRESLLGAEHISKLLGYETADVLAALESLYEHHLIKQTRPSNGARLYQFCEESLDEPTNTCFHGLMAIARSRAGRVEIVRILKKTGQRGSIVNVAEKIRRTQHDAQRTYDLCPVEKVTKTWLKAS